MGPQHEGAAVYFGFDEESEGHWTYADRIETFLIAFKATKNPNTALRRHALVRKSDAEYVLLPKDHAIYTILGVWDDKAVVHNNQNTINLMKVDTAALAKYNDMPIGEEGPTAKKKK